MEKKVFDKAAANGHNSKTRWGTAAQASALPKALPEKNLKKLLTGERKSCITQHRRERAARFFDKWRASWEIELWVRFENFMFSESNTFQLESLILAQIERWRRA